MDYGIHKCFLFQNKLNSLNKILPLVLVLSVSLIIGNQAAYAETDVWAMYCEDGTQDPTPPASDLTNMGAINDANPTGVIGQSDSTTCALKGDANYPSNIIRLPWGDLGNPIVYKTISEKNSIDNDPDILVKCFDEAADPVNGQFEWNFNLILEWDCVDNFRADDDLGIGVDDPALSAQQVLELQNGELIVLDLSALLGEYENFMFMLSSNTLGETGWLATSDVGPTGNVDDSMLNVLNSPTFFPGCVPNNNAPNSCSNTDEYISFTPQKFLYVKQLGENRDILFQQIKADKIEIVGGHGGPIDKTSLLVTGAQLNASWMIPVLVSAIGIGLFVVTRKS